jgi:hypothetical protein
MPPSPAILSRKQISPAQRINRECLGRRIRFVQLAEMLSHLRHDSRAL